VFRYDRDQYTWKADSSQLLRAKGMRVGSNLFHVGIILLFFGHLVGLLMPESVYHLVMSAQTKQLMAMVAGGIFGSICFVGLTILIRRRLFDPRIRATSKPTDIAVLLILYVQLILGLITIPYSAQHLDGSSMVALGNWAQHIVTFRSGAADFVLAEAWVFKVHLFLGLTIFLLFPFTRLVHMLSAPLKYLTRKGYQVVRKRG
jgi:nitrate reductase gamma subunit